MKLVRRIQLNIAIWKKIVSEIPILLQVITLMYVLISEHMENHTKEFDAEMSLQENCEFAI